MGRGFSWQGFFTERRAPLRLAEAGPKWMAKGFSHSFTSPARWPKFLASAICGLFARGTIIPIFGQWC
jgi:hypothetical protein